MTEREFARRIFNGKKDILQAFLDFMKAEKIPFCLIGGLAVNAYAEPVVSLDLDVVAASDRLLDLRRKLPAAFKVKTFPNSLNLSAAGSDLRIQLQTDPRYQTFLKRARRKRVLGYLVPVAAIEDVFQGKVWAAMDETRRPSKRQKDLADIQRLLEVDPELRPLLPAAIAKRLS